MSSEPHVDDDFECKTNTITVNLEEIHKFTEYIFRVLPGVQEDTFHESFQLCSALGPIQKVRIA